MLSIRSLADSRLIVEMQVADFINTIVSSPQKSPCCQDRNLNRAVTLERPRPRRLRRSYSCTDDLEDRGVATEATNDFTSVGPYSNRTDDAESVCLRTRASAHRICIAS